MSCGCDSCVITGADCGCGPKSSAGADADCASGVCSVTSQDGPINPSFGQEGSSRPPVWVRWSNPGRGDMRALGIPDGDNADIFMRGQPISQMRAPAFTGAGTDTDDGATRAPQAFPPLTPRMEMGDGQMLNSSGQPTSGFQGTAIIPSSGQTPTKTLSRGPINPMFLEAAALSTIPDRFGASGQAARVTSSTTPADPKPDDAARDAAAREAALRAVSQGIDSFTSVMTAQIQQANETERARIRASTERQLASMQQQGLLSQQQQADMLAALLQTLQRAPAPPPPPPPPPPATMETSTKVLIGLGAILAVVVVGFVVWKVTAGSKGGARSSGASHPGYTFGPSGAPATGSRGSKPRSYTF